MIIIKKKNDRYFMVSDDQTVELTEISKDGSALVLPENEAGRKFIQLTKIDRLGEVELVPIDRSAPTTKKPKTPSISDLKDYVSDEIWKEIEKASAKWVTDHTPKPLTKEEKLLKELEKVQKELEKIRNNKEGA